MDSRSGNDAVPGGRGRGRGRRASTLGDSLLYSENIITAAFNHVSIGDSSSSKAPEPVNCNDFREQERENRVVGEVPRPKIFRYSLDERKSRDNVQVRPQVIKNEAAAAPVFDEVITRIPRDRSQAQARENASYHLPYSPSPARAFKIVGQEYRRQDEPRVQSNRNTVPKLVTLPRGPPNFTTLPQKPKKQATPHRAPPMGMRGNVDKDYLNLMDKHDNGIDSDEHWGSD